MAKRLTSRYRPGARSADWRKIKVRRTAGVVVGGWLGGAGGRSGDLGALLVGWWDGAGPPRYAGRVGTGFDGAERRRLLDRLGGLDASSRPTLADAPRLPDARWVAPRLVCRVEYGEITEAWRLRAPSYKGLLDVDPAACPRPGDVG
jgi:bifunctional non-homologous end joining protein LigD